MSVKNFNEKDEKDEKEVDKREEKTVEEKWRRDPLSALTWAAIFIWAGLVFLANNLNLIHFKLINALPIGLGFLQPDLWMVVLLGAGVILLIEVAIRLLVPAYRSPVGGTIIFALILIGLGLSNMLGWDVVWPLILVGVGLSLVVRGFTRRSK